MALPDVSRKSSASTVALCILVAMATVLTIASALEVPAGKRRSYGTWEDRKRLRDCEQIMCLYRYHNCTVYTQDNTWFCNSLRKRIEANKCSIRVCDASRGQVCNTFAPGDNYVEIEADTCDIDQKCFVEQLATTTTTNAPAPPTTANTLLTNGMADLNNVTDTNSTDASLFSANGTATIDNSAAGNFTSSGNMELSTTASFGDGVVTSSGTTESTAAASEGTTMSTAEIASSTTPGDAMEG